MSTSVVLPALGESVTEGTVTRWLKNVGDTVQADEGLLETLNLGENEFVRHPLEGNHIPEPLDDRFRSGPYHHGRGFADVRTWSRQALEHLAEGRGGDRACALEQVRQSAPQEVDVEVGEQVQRRLGGHTR